MCIRDRRERIAVTESVVDVLLGFVGRRPTVDLVVSERRQWNTLGDTESYVEVHQTTAAQQVPTLYTIGTI